MNRGILSQMMLDTSCEQLFDMAMSSISISTRFENTVTAFTFAKNSYLMVLFASLMVSTKTVSR